MGLGTGSQVQAWEEVRTSAQQDQLRDGPCCSASSSLFFCGTWSCFPSRAQVDNSSAAVLRSAESRKVSAEQSVREDCRVPPSQQSIGSEGTDVSIISIGDEELKLSSQLRKFCLSDLKAATRNFRPDSLLGEGGFGYVFKGWIDEHGTAPVKPGTGLTVAVKTLNHNGLQGHKEWLAELNFLGQLHHANLVKLIGYCIEGEQRLLVYEFMQRGSLENHLFRKGALPLPWNTRMKIALGAAKGLAFLHGGERPVIYRDFKTSNILLDGEYNPKLSDFGLAKDGPVGDKTHISTRVMGTFGYAAPEYVMTGHLTVKNDVYSFGVVLLEMLTGRRTVDRTRPKGWHNLIEWARPYLSDKRKVFRLIDPRLEGQYSEKGAQKAANLAHRCLNRDPRARPLMTEVVDCLGSLQNLKDMANNYYHTQATAGAVGRRMPQASAIGNMQQMGRRDHMGPSHQPVPQQAGRNT